ncbi:MAG: hypothetical protein JWN50_683 [Parcubacteria group bacterium]|nr:hypothetical protein [Parcubacteria group bacterium]
MEPRKWIIRFRARDKFNFDEVVEDLKKVETRAATDKYRKITKGDILVFVCGKNRLEKKIKKVELFKTLDAMYRKINYKKIMPSQPSAAAAKRVNESYPGYKEKLKAFGVIAYYI